MILIKQKYYFLEKISFDFGFCENSGCILIYHVLESRIDIYSPPQSFMEKISRNQKRLKNHQPVDILILSRAWKIDETGKLL